MLPSAILQASFLRSIQRFDRRLGRFFYISKCAEERTLANDIRFVHSLIDFERRKGLRNLLSLVWTTEKRFRR